LCTWVPWHLYRTNFSPKTHFDHKIPKLEIPWEKKTKPSIEEETQRDDGLKPRVKAGDIITKKCCLFKLGLTNYIN
jgi:hypothetical protein